MTKIDINFTLIFLISRIDVPIQFFMVDISFLCLCVSFQSLCVCVTVILKVQMESKERKPKSAPVNSKQ